MAASRSDQVSNPDSCKINVTASPGNLTPPDFGRTFFRNLTLLSYGRDLQGGHDVFYGNGDALSFARGKSTRALPNKGNKIRNLWAAIIVSGRVGFGGGNRPLPNAIAGSAQVGIGSKISGNAITQELAPRSRLGPKASRHVDGFLCMRYKRAYMPQAPTTTTTIYIRLFGGSHNLFAPDGGRAIGRRNLSSAANAQLRPHR
jgi:hypothetical protein